MPGVAPRISCESRPPSCCSASSRPVRVFAWIRSSVASAWARSMRPLSEGAHREFARLGQPCALLQGQFQRAAEGQRAAMAMNFDDILARIGVRCAEEDGHRLIIHAAIGSHDLSHSVAVADGNVTPAPWSEDALQNRQRLGTAQADDADAPFARPGSQLPLLYRYTAYTSASCRSHGCYLAGQALAVAKATARCRPVRHAGRNRYACRSWCAVAVGYGRQYIAPVAPYSHDWASARRLAQRLPPHPRPRIARLPRR